MGWTDGKVYKVRRYPSGPDEVMAAAKEKELTITHESAQNFMDFWDDEKWMKNGKPIRDWTKQLPGWIENAREMARFRNSRSAGGRIEPSFRNYGPGADLDALLGPRHDGVDGGGSR